MESCKHCIVKTKILNETIQELGLELSLCQRQLQQYKNNQMEEIHSRRLQALNAYKIEYDSTHDILAPITSYPHVENTTHFDEVDSNK